MYLYDRNMVTNTKLKYAQLLSNYYVIMMLQNLKKSKIFNFFIIPEARSAELKQEITAKQLFAQDTS